MRLSLFVALAAALVASSPPTQAQSVQYPWCAYYGGRGGGGTNCGFSTLEQCRATVHGMGGTCEPNLMYQPRQTGAASGKKRKKTSDQ